MKKRHPRYRARRRTIEEELGLHQPILITNQNGVYRKVLVDERPKPDPAEVKLISPWWIASVIVAVMAIFAAAVWLYLKH